MKKTWINFACAPTLLLSMYAFSAQAGQELGDSCADVRNGTTSGLLSKLLICANQKWQDPMTLPSTSISIARFTPAKKYDDEVYGVSLLGLEARLVTRQNECFVERAATVVDFNADNTAKIAVSLNDNCQGWQTQVDQVVPLNKPTKIATDNNGNEYHIVVSRQGN